MTLKNNVTSSFVHHFITICEFKLELQSVKSWVLPSVTFTFDLWPWLFAWTSLLSLIITPINFMMIRWWEHSEKGVTDRQTDGGTDGRTEGRTDGRRDRRTEGGTEGRTDGRTEGRTDGRTDGHTDWTIHRTVSSQLIKKYGYICNWFLFVTITYGYQLISPWTKWLSYSRRHFQIHFHWFMNEKFCTWTFT